MIVAQKPFPHRVGKVYILGKVSVCGKPQERVSPILDSLTSHSDSDIERWSISLKENKPDGVDRNSNGLDYCLRNNKGKVPWFSAD